MDQSLLGIQFDSEYESLLNQASESVLSAIIKLGGKGKIVEENELDERSF